MKDKMRILRYKTADIIKHMTELVATYFTKREVYADKVQVVFYADKKHENEVYFWVFEKNFYTKHLEHLWNTKTKNQ